VLVQRKDEGIENFAQRKTCGKANRKCAGVITGGPILWFNFYGAVLARREIAELLGVTVPTALKRFPKAAAFACSKERPHSVPTGKP
jgi:hypothetical protein